MSSAGKLVVVTGAGSGIGRATALRFARDGAQTRRATSIRAGSIRWPPSSAIAPR
jgi:NAD(P)-dependent dehydrogenase (short-subunit alcohol dehydrogenase family)